MKRIFSIVILFGIFFTPLYSQEFPERPYNSSLIYDFTDLFENEEKIILSKIQNKYKEKKRIDILIISVKSMNGLNSNEYTYKLADYWNLDKTKKQLLIIIKPKYENEKGEIFIATSYGRLDRNISDYEIKKIIDNIMIPQFKKGKILKGIKLGIKKIMKKL